MNSTLKNIMLILIEKGFLRNAAYKIVQEWAMKSWNNNSEFSEILINNKELNSFKKFTFWSEHLILHTYKSLKTILTKSGFKNIDIKFYQRYDFSNHLGWFLKRKPGGHNFYKEIISDSLNSSYCENLKKLGLTDTLIAIAK